MFQFDEDLADVRGEIYPLLSQALKALLEEINSNEQVNKYQTVLARKKIYDALEQKHIEKERLISQLKDEYESSDEGLIQQHIETLGFTHQQLIQLIQHKLQRSKKMQKADLLKRYRQKMKEGKEDEEFLEEKKIHVIQEQKAEHFEDQDEPVLPQAEVFNPILFLVNKMQLLCKAQSQMFL